MKTLFKTSFILALGLQLVIIIALATTSCAHSKSLEAKKSPAYIGVEIELQPYVDQYFDLSRQNNLFFTNNVTIGLTKIDRGSVIGLCTYGWTFREIDIDYQFFMESPELTRKALLFHELTHCYCARGHDHDEGIDYSENVMYNLGIKIIKEIPWCLNKKNAGYLEDGCASSIMHPYIQDYQCLEKHWDYYIKEMFNRCQPY